MAEATERQIFKYHDGTRERFGDPFLIVRRLRQGGELESLAGLAEAEQEPETTEFLTLVRQAFQVDPLDSTTGVGLTDWEVLALFNRFGEWMEALKKNISPGPTSPPPTDSESSTSQEPPSETMSGPSDSGCAPGE